MGLLDGVKVVELGLILPGAALGHLLAEQGADVVKVDTARIEALRATGIIS
jgi:crotonobetainyl-CoA:carnitine CoA-transferase CaiB-like acyl-CoA transferase